MANQSEVLSTLGLLADYYGHEPSDAQLGLYARALSDLDAEVLDYAAGEWIKAGKWYPKVSELRELAAKAHPVTFDAEQQNAEDHGNWQRAMTLLNASFRGEISEAQLYSDRTWQAHTRREAVQRADHPDAWELAQKQTAAWMAEDAAF